MSHPTATPLPSSLPYMLRALYEWLVDNNQTPYICVNAKYPGVMVPPSIIKDGKTTLNLAMRATVNLQMTNDAITFGCRIGGKHTNISIPCSAVMAIYSQENGQGQMFEPVVVEELTEVPVNAPIGSIAPDAPAQGATRDREYQNTWTAPESKPAASGTDGIKKRPSHLSVVRND